MHARSANGNASLFRVLGAALIVALSPSAPAQTVAKDLVATGDSKYKNGDLDGAMADYGRALDLDPKLAAARINRGVARRAKGDLDGAIADFGRALELDPQNVFVLNLRGLVRHARGDLDGALADYDRALNLDPKNVPAYNNRGLLWQDRGHLDFAVADLGHALDLDPKLAAALRSRACIHFAQGKWNDALADFRQVGQLDTSDQIFPHFGIWLVRTQLNDAEAANKELAAFFDSRTEGAPGDWPSKVAAFLLGKTSQADLLDAAVSKDALTDGQQHCAAWCYAGMVHLLANDNVAATTCFQNGVTTGARSCMEYQFAAVELKVLDKKSPAVPDPADPIILKKNP